MSNQKVTIYHNPSCSKSRETLALLKEQNCEVEIIEYLKETPSEAEIKDLLKKLKIKPEQLLRKGEAIYKDNFKDKDLTDEEWIKVMIENPKLIERPIVVNGNKAVIGRPPILVLDII